MYVSAVSTLSLAVSYRRMAPSASTRACCSFPLSASFRQATPVSGARSARLRISYWSMTSSSCATIQKVPPTAYLQEREPFLACSFWLVDNYILQGRYAEARKLFDRLLGRCNDVGLLAEELDPLTGRMLGNFPQAYSHVGLINCALNLSRQTGPAEERAES